MDKLQLKGLTKKFGGLTVVAVVRDVYAALGYEWDESTVGAVDDEAPGLDVGLVGDAIAVAFELRDSAPLDAETLVSWGVDLVKVDDIRRLRIEVAAARTAEPSAARIGHRDRDAFAQCTLCRRHRHGRQRTAFGHSSRGIACRPCRIASGRPSAPRARSWLQFRFAMPVADLGQSISKSPRLLKVARQRRLDSSNPLMPGWRARHRRLPSPR